MLDRMLIKSLIGSNSKRRVKSNRPRTKISRCSPFVRGLTLERLEERVALAANSLDATFGNGAGFVETAVGTPGAL